MGLRMDRPPTYPRLRIRRLGGGFHRDDVLYALRELEETLRRIEQELEQARERARDLEGRLQASEAEAAALRAREQQVTDSIAGAERRASEIEQTAETRARAILAVAEEQAAKIRGEAHLRIEDTGKQLEQLLVLKGKTIASMRAIVGELDRAIGRIERGEAVDGQPAQPAAAEVWGHRDIPPAAPVVERAPADEPLFERRVELDAGPFLDFGALSGFERVLAQLPHIEDVYVRRFFDERAIIELTTSQELPLLTALRSALPCRFEVERSDPDALRITLGSTLAETR